MIEPWLYGTRVGISSLALLVTSVFWAVLWGPAGLILSTPLTVCVVVLGRYVPQLSFLHILLGDEPVLAAEAQIYQRLLAMDQLEAHTVAGEFLKGKLLVELYDQALIPALSMAEQDRHKGTIDAAREEFLFLSINEMIAEFSEYELEPSGLESSNSAPHGDARVLVVPAQDRADEVTAAMLSQLLGLRRASPRFLFRWWAPRRMSNGRCLKPGTAISCVYRLYPLMRSRRREPCANRSASASPN